VNEKNARDEEKQAVFYDGELAVRCGSDSTDIKLTKQGQEISLTYPELHGLLHETWPKIKNHFGISNKQEPEEIGNGYDYILKFFSWLRSKMQG
jgi:hypothetical protein